MTAASERKPTIGMVVPALAGGGGVPAVADFLCRQIERTGRYGLQVYSLPTANGDADSRRLRAPATWIGYPRTSHGTWRGRDYTSVGASGIELEFQRYQPRARLTALLRGCDLVQVVAGAPAVALAAARCGRPVVLQVATRTRVERQGALVPGSVPLRLWRQAMTLLVDRLDDRALAQVDAVMVENAWMYDYARAHVARPGATVAMASPGVDSERFRPDVARATALREDPYILFVGRLDDPRKNLGLLCEAYARLCGHSRLPPRLVIAGKGALPDEARRALGPVHGIDRVRLAGAPDDAALVALYQRAACLALPSTEEGFGLVVIEAMACGVPVVATRCGGPEGIISDGVDGRLVPLGDAEALAAAVADLCGDMQANERMGLAARLKIEARYSESAAFQPFLDTYERLLRQALPD
jgi:glycosyltransferase involved in cell wall biosynthesis